MEYREVLGGDVRTSEDDGQHYVEAKVCSYGVGPDTYQTTWQRGTFADGFASHGLPAIAWGHDSRSIIGSVVSADDRADGLYVRGKFANFDEVPKAREAYSLLRDGHVKGWSFGFADGETQPDPEHRGAQQFTKARMYEVSPVLRASIPLTSTVSVRSADGDAVEAATDGDLVSALSQALSSGTRQVTITVGDAPETTPAVIPTGNPEPQVDEIRSDGPDLTTVSDLVLALDATAEEAAGYITQLRSEQLDGFDPDVRRAFALVLNLRDGLSGLRTELDLPDPDDDPEPVAAVRAGVKSGDTVKITGGKGSGKTGKVTHVMPNGVLVVDIGTGDPFMVAAKNAAPSDDSDDDERSAVSDEDIRAAQDALTRIETGW